MSDTNNVNTINYQDYFELSNGTAQLKEDYKGSENSWKLPEVMVIPDQIDGTEVEFLADSMFKNNTHVKEITLPTTATAIPHDFCCNATNLRSIRNKDGNTETITYIGGAAFAHTRIKEALFPNLKILDLKEVDDNKTGEKSLWEEPSQAVPIWRSLILER